MDALRYLHHGGAAAAAPPEVRGRAHPEPVGQTGLALERRRAVAAARGPGRPHPAGTDDEDGERHVPRAAPRHVARAGVAEPRRSVDRDVGHLDWGEPRRTSKPEVTRVLGPRIGVRATPAIWIDGAAAIRAIHAEVQVRARGGAGHAGDADDLAPIDVLALVDPDMRHVSVEGDQAVAVVDLDG